MIELTLHIHARTDLAVLVSLDGEKDAAVWLPRSEIEFRRLPRSNSVIVELPEWLAIEKGLV